MGLFAKLREGLTKTRDSLMGRVDTLVKETRKIDEDFYEELEDILLMSGLRHEGDNRHDG